MKLPKDLLSQTYTKPRIFLCEVDKERICELQTTNTNAAFKFNSFSELSFEVARVYNDVITGEVKVNPYYDKIEALRVIEIEEFGFFEIQGPEVIGDGIKEVKNVTAYSLEYTLAQKYLNNFIVNTGTIDSIEVINAENPNDITPVSLYNPQNPNLSLLHLVLGHVYGWSIGHVDTSLQSLGRQFEVERESVYDFLINEVCEKFNCYIVFDTQNNTINIYAENLTAKFLGDGSTNIFTIYPAFSAVETVSIDGYKTTKWNYNTTTGQLTLEDAPDFGQVIEVIDGDFTKWETDVFVSFDNLSQEINVSYDADSIKTKLEISYGDDGDIREANLGMPYLLDLSYYHTVDWMGQDLYDAYNAYLIKSNSFKSTYAQNTQEILEINDRIYYEEYRLSLNYSVAQSVNSLTVGTYYIKQTGEDQSVYFKEVHLPTEWVEGTVYYSNLTTNVNEDKVTKLCNALKKYFINKNDDVDDETSWSTDMSGLDEDFVFIQEKTNGAVTLSKLQTSLSAVTTNRTTNQTVRAVINNFLAKIWDELGRTPLNTMFLEPYNELRETGIEAGWSDTTQELYGYHYTNLLFISSIESAIMQRNLAISDLEFERQTPENNNAAISESLDLSNEDNFTPSQLIKLGAFFREDKLEIDNIIETNQDSISSSIRVKQDAMESGKIELQKLCQPQLQFSMTMANIYAIPEFEPIVHQFQLGNVIKVALRPDYIKQSRLMQVNINFDNFNEFSCEFGELTSLRSQSDIHADLLKNAVSAGKSVAANSGKWTRGTDIATAIDLKLQQGLLDAVTQIKSTDGTQGVIIDKYGIKLQKVNENGEVDPKQAWIVNNMILMSDDGFQTSKTALGNVTVDGESYYGLISEIMLSGYIEGSTIRGGTIGIGEYIDPVDNTKKYHFEVDKDGNVTMNASRVAINGYATSDDVNNLGDRVSDAESDISLVVSDKKVNAASIVTAINNDGSNISISADRVNLKGAVTFESFDDDTRRQIEADTIDVQIWSSRGNIFKSRDVSSVLSCHVFKAGVEITETLPNSAFTWQKFNDDGSQDEMWTATPYGNNVKTIHHHCL